MSNRPEDSILTARRSIHVNASPKRVWEEFSSFERMSAWWGHIKGDPQAGTSKGQWLDAYEPRIGERIVMAVIRLKPVLGGTMVELFHHGFERTGDSPWLDTRQLRGRLGHDTALGAQTNRRVSVSLPRDALKGEYRWQPTRRTPL